MRQRENKLKRIDCLFKETMHSLAAAMDKSIQLLLFFCSDILQ